MERIEVGEYVRTTNNGVKRIDTIFKNATVNRYGYEIGSDWDGTEYGIIKTTEIVKHSKNIIDLIEVGDYVNGYKVLNVIIDSAPSGKCVDIDSSKDSSECTLWEEDIKSILTYEQYNQNCYRLEVQSEHRKRQKTS